MNRWYTGFGVFVLVLYAAAISLGWEMGAATRGQKLPPGVKQSPGGYRNYVFWRGGK